MSIKVIWLAKSGPISYSKIINCNYTDGMVESKVKQSVASGMMYIISIEIFLLYIVTSFKSKQNLLNRKKSLVKIATWYD